MAEQLNSPEKPFDPIGNVYALPDDFVPPVYGEEEYEGEPMELEEEFQTDEEIANEKATSDEKLVDNLSADTDIFG